MYSPIRFSENDRVDTESNEINILTNDKVLRASLADTVNFSGKHDSLKKFSILSKVCGFDLNNSQMSVQKN